MNSKLSWNNFSSESKYKHYELQNILTYDKRSKHFKGRNVFWSSKRAQDIRFEILIRIGDLNNKTLLDVGCGHGDFLLFLEERGIKVKQYTGIDINPKVIEVAKIQCKGKNATFEVRNILNNPYDSNSFDYVFASGIFAFKGDDWKNYVKDMLKEMFDICKLGVGVNFLKKNSYYNYSSLQYNDPEDVYNFVKKEVTPNVVLRDNYTFDDFTLFLYKIK